MALGIAWQMCLKPRARSRPKVPYAISQQPGKFLAAQEGTTGDTPLDQLLSRLRATRARREGAGRNNFLKQRQRARMI